MQNNIEEILQKIYNSEIHVRMGWLWDGGFEYSIGSTSNDLWNLKFNTAKIVCTGEDNISDGVKIMANDIAIEYPESTFAEWWNKRQ